MLFNIELPNRRSFIGWNLLLDTFENLYSTEIPLQVSDFVELRILVSDLGVGILVGVLLNLWLITGVA